MIKLIIISGEYLESTLYHPGLVYEPTEQVMNMVTMWAAEHPNTGTARRYLKVLQAFCRHYEKQIIDKIKAAQILPNFERYVHINDIKRWMSDRWKKRELNGSESPFDRTIENEARIVGNYLTWAKETLANQSINVPYDGGKYKQQIIHLKRDSNFLAGIVDTIKVNQLHHTLHLSHKPEPGTRPRIIAQSTQNSGHLFLPPHELELFITSFSDPIWTFLALSAYHTGLRPHELLAIPRYAPYDHGTFFTADPSILRQLKAEGQQEIIYECLGKGGKDRKVTFIIDEWIAIMDLYEPFFQERRRYFEHAAGRKLKTHELWLRKPQKNPEKMVQYCLPDDQLNYDKFLQPLRSAVSYAKKKNRLEEKFGHAVNFYSLRHTFATNFIANELKRNNALREQAGRTPDILLRDYALRKRLQDQLGHENFDTTFKHYIDNVVSLQAMSFPSVDTLIADARKKNHLLL